MVNNLEENNLRDEKIFSVSEYVRIVNQGLKNFRSKIIGEISEVNFGPTGHVYFTLKDEKDGSIIRCVIWKMNYGLYGIELKEGVKIVVSGCPNLHPRYGFKFIADVIELAGEGILKKEYERLRKRLLSEGLFEKSKKRLLPEYPQKIGVITSRKGAVLADFLNNLGRFGFKIKMIDSRVEGQTAVADLLSSIKIFKKKDIDVLVVMRGGGSLESMLSFNNELLVREIADFPVPVIAAIGHHKDVSLVALAADFSVSTPSIAATVISESWAKVALLLERGEKIIINYYSNALGGADLLIVQSLDIIRRANDLIFGKYKVTKAALKIFFQRFEDVLQGAKINLKNFSGKSIFGFKSLLSIISRQLEHSDKIIFLNNPERQLKLGYSIARSNGKLFRSVKNAKIGEDLNIEVTDGTIASEIKSINKK